MAARAHALHAQLYKSVEEHAEQFEEEEDEGTQEEGEDDEEDLQMKRI